jgi:hypothetical protein
MSQNIVEETTEARSRAQSTASESSWHWAKLAPYLAEGLGTFGLVFAGCGAIVIDTLP